MPTPTLQHPEIIAYPTTVYQKIAVSPFYIAVPVASEDEVLALSGPVFLSAEAALRYQPPPEQPFANMRRTDNFEQFHPGKSELGREIPVPVERETAAKNTYVRTGAPDQPDPPPETQAAAAADPNAPLALAIAQPAQQPAPPVPAVPSTPESAPNAASQMATQHTAIKPTDPNAPPGDPNAPPADPNAPTAPAPKGEPSRGPGEPTF